ncbi:MAG: molecular chaperone [Lachnospiraceae bacterium]|nr:molecular chaperone [Lachnospiraceae bacterium]
MSGLTRYEKETIILTNEADDFYEVYTFNSALKKKLAAYAKRHPDLCSLKETTKEGSATYVVDKARLSLRLTEPYSEVRKQAAREQARDNGFGGKVAG